MTTFKRTATAAIISMFGGAVVLLGAEQKPWDNIEIKPRRTHAELEKKRPQGHRLDEHKTVRLEDVHRAAHRKAKQKKGLIDRSSIVSSNYDWTLVPRGAILHVPPAYKKRVNEGRNGKLVGWSDFYAKNNAWIRLLPVTIEQASGVDPLRKEYLDSLQRTGLLVVAVCKGGPISVKLPADPAQPESGSGGAGAAPQSAQVETASAPAPAALR